MVDGIWSECTLKWHTLNRYIVGGRVSLVSNIKRIVSRIQDKLREDRLK